MNRRDLVCGMLGTTAALLPFPAAAASPKKIAPTSPLPSLKAAIRRGRGSIAAVWPEGRPIQTGVMVATSGIFLTVGDFSSRPLNVICSGGAQQIAQQLAFDPQTQLSAHRLSVVPAHCESLALALSAHTGWAVGLFANDVGVTGALGQCTTSQPSAAKARFDLPCPKGSAVVDSRGALVGIVQQKRGANQCDVLLRPALTAFLKKVAKIT